MKHIIVCVKAVVMKPSAQGAVRDTQSLALNPFDRPALKAALTLKSNLGAHLTALSMGPHSAQIALYEALALGVDRAVLISDPALADSDTLATSLILAAGIRLLAPVDLVLFGPRTCDSDTGQVGPQTAARLDLPLTAGVVDLDLGPEALTLKRRIDGFMETWRLCLPGVLTIDPGYGEAPEPDLAGISQAFGTASIEHLGLADLGLGPEQVGEPGSGTRVLSLKRSRRERTCEFLQGPDPDRAKELAERLLDAGLIQ